MEKGEEMLILSDLKNRVYSGKQCTRFEYNIMMDKDSKQEIVAVFKKVALTEWRMQILIDGTRDKDTEVYNFNYIMPKAGLPLELIAATGLRYFQLYIKEEIQLKSNLDFELGEILKGM